MSIFMCKCKHASWAHRYGFDRCHGKKSHPTDKRRKKVDCMCTKFKPGLSLKEHMDKAHA